MCHDILLKKRRVVEKIVEISTCLSQQLLKLYVGFSTTFYVSSISCPNQPPPSLTMKIIIAQVVGTPLSEFLTD